MRRLVSTLVMILVPAAVAADTVTLDAEQQRRAGVEIAEVATHSFVRAVPVVGRISRPPGSTYPVKTIVHGRIEKVLIAPGQEVAANQPLLVLHSHEVHRIQGELLRARRSLEIAERALDAGRQLLEIEGISRLEVERREQEVLRSELEVEMAEAELTDLGLTPDDVAGSRAVGEERPDLTLRAAAAGVVLDLRVATHDWIQPFQTLVVLGEPSRIELELQVPPEQAEGTAGASVRFRPVGRPQADGLARVITSVPQVDERTRTVTLRARIESAPPGAVPGVFVEGSLEAGGATLPAVPAAAVAHAGGRDVVFVRTAPNRFEMRPVELGPFDGERYAVREGIRAGEEVAVAGVFLLKSALVRGGGEGP